MRRNALSVWIGLAVVLLVVLNLPGALSLGVKNLVRESLAPMQETLARSGRAWREGVATVRGLGGAVADQQRLAGEVARLQAELRDVRALQDENTRLRAALGFSVRAGRDLVPGEVIARNRDGWWQTLRVNRGWTGGFATNRAVVSSDGLVGRVQSASENTSDILLLSDPTCRVAAQILRSGSHGIVSGRGPSWEGQVVCRMEFINKDAPIVPGDEVVTSGLGGVFPAGLLIGYVERVRTDRSGLFQYAEVLSKADLGRVAYVYAVRGTSPGSPHVRSPSAEGPTP